MTKPENENYLRRLMKLSRFSIKQNVIMAVILFGGLWLVFALPEDVLRMFSVFTMIGTFFATVCIFRMANDEERRELLLKMPKNEKLTTKSD